MAHSISCARLAVSIKDGRFWPCGGVSLGGEVMYERCCGLDVHQRSVVACVVVPGARGRPEKTIRTFGTTIDELENLVDWLIGQGVTHAAMESTGVLWKPVFNILAERLEVLVVNARHVKAVPGRKTDVADSEWLADLLQHGLLRP